jgi:hypothetical protein
VAKTKRRRKPKMIHLHGRRWFRRTCGNTYHTVTVWTVWVDGEHVVKTLPKYGYGDQWEWTARQWLATHGYLAGLEGDEPLWRWCERNGVKLVRECSDVARKRDL